MIVRQLHSKVFSAFIVRNRVRYLISGSVNTATAPAGAVLLQLTITILGARGSGGHYTDLNRGIQKRTGTPEISPQTSRPIFCQFSIFVWHLFLCVRERKVCGWQRWLRFGCVCARARLCDNVRA
jgi:hypothetical protein